MKKEILYKFFDGQASAEEKEAVRSWLEASPDHEKELFREREFFDAMILSGNRRQGVQAKRFHGFFRKIAREAGKIAAVVAIVVACGSYFYQWEMRKVAGATNTITVPAGQRVNLTLPDGTNVWLNANSEMRYPAVFSKEERKIVLDGEAYFEVTHNAHKPFIVQTSKCNVEVLGTKFNVEAYSNSADFCTSLMEGSVKVWSKLNPAEKLVLSPNHQTSLVDGHLQTKLITDFDLFRWKEGLICFRNMNFNELMVRFEKCYGIHIVIENEKLNRYVCSGKFRISDGIDKALRILQKDAGYRFVRSKDDSIIYIK